VARTVLDRVDTADTAGLRPIAVGFGVFEAIGRSLGDRRVDTIGDRRRWRVPTSRE
jgi:hypothetical protein